MSPLSLKLSVVDRFDFIISECRNKRVLHLGSLAADRKSTLHQKILDVSSECWGLDQHSSTIPNHILGDAQNYNLSHLNPDIILAGEIIEHIYDIKGFFESAYTTLQSGCSLIITTPNAFSLVHLVKAVFGKIVKNDPYHVLLYDPTTLSNLYNCYLQTFFWGSICFYREASARTFIYRLCNVFSFLSPTFSPGIILKLTKR